MVRSAAPSGKRVPRFGAVDDPSAGLYVKQLTCHFRFFFYGRQSSDGHGDP